MAMLRSPQPVGKPGGSLGAIAAASPLNRGTIGPRPKPLNLNDGPTRGGSPIGKPISQTRGTIGPKPGGPLNLNDGPRRATIPVLPGTRRSERSEQVHAALAAGQSPRRMKDNEAKIRRQTKMVDKLKSSKGKVDRKQKDRFMRAAKFRLGR